MSKTFGLLLGLLLIAPLAQAVGTTFEVNKTDMDSSQFTVVSFSGPLLEGTGEAVASSMESSKYNRVVLELNSLGGRTKESDLIKASMDKLRANGKTVDTFVANGSTCQSACTLLFMYGDHRIAGEAATFMFHSVQNENMRGYAVRDATNLMLYYYKSRGLSATWISELQAQGVFTTVNEFYISGKDADQQKIGLVTETVSSLVIQKSLPFDPQIHAR